LHQHRQDLRKAVAKTTPPVRLLALKWSLDDIPPTTIFKICNDRVVQRGENHQTLRAKTDDKMHEEVIWQFIKSTEALTEGEVDACIDMDINDTLEEAVKRAVEGCVEELGLPPPTPEKLQEGLDAANEYMVDSKKKQEMPKKKEAKTRYYGLLPEVDLKEVIGRRFELADDISKESRAFWEKLKSDDRVEKHPHVTITHRNNLPGESELWDQCALLQQMDPPPRFRMKLDSVAWNDRVMAISVDLEDADQTEGDDFILSLPFHVKMRLHITVATRDAKVKPVEAMALVQSWRGHGVGGDGQMVKLDDVFAFGRLAGLS
jgi:tRNA ligase